MWLNAVSFRHFFVLVRRSFCSNAKPPISLASHDQNKANDCENDRQNTAVGRQGKEIEVVASSLRVDAVAAIGLDISRRVIWEKSLDGLLYLNGLKLEKKSIKVKEGDIIEVDSCLKSTQPDSTKEFLKTSETDRQVVKRGRVVVKEIGPLTRKGKYRLILVRYKQFRLLEK